MTEQGTEMTSDDQFWLRIWKLVAVVLCVLIASVAGCTAHNTHRIALLSAGGTDPILARCAVLGARGDEGICQMATMKAAK